MPDSFVELSIRRALHEFIKEEDRLLAERLIPEPPIDAYLDKVLSRGECLLHLHGGAILATLLGYCNAPDRRITYVSLLLVSRAARGQGLGQNMMHRFIENARRRGFSAVQLEVARTNNDAMRFYSKPGFVAIEERTRMRLLELDLRT